MKILSMNVGADVKGLLISAAESWTKEDGRRFIIPLRSRGILKHNLSSQLIWCAAAALSWIGMLHIYIYSYKDEMDQSQYDISYYYPELRGLLRSWLHSLLALFCTSSSYGKSRAWFVLFRSAPDEGDLFAADADGPRTTLTSVTSAGPRRLKRTAPSGQQQQQHRRPLMKSSPSSFFFSRETHLEKEAKNYYHPAARSRPSISRLILMSSLIRFSASSSPSHLPQLAIQFDRDQLVPGLHFFFVLFPYCPLLFPNIPQDSSSYFYLYSC